MYWTYPCHHYYSMLKKDQHLNEIFEFTMPSIFNVPLYLSSGIMVKNLPNSQFHNEMQTNTCYLTHNKKKHVGGEGWDWDNFINWVHEWFGENFNDENTFNEQGKLYQTHLAWSKCKVPWQINVLKIGKRHK